MEPIKGAIQDDVSKLPNEETTPEIESCGEKLG
jgi:hypothetical protein